MFLNSVVASLIMSDSTAHLKMIQMKSTSTSHQHSHSRCTIVFCINILTPCFFRAGHVTCSGHTTLDGGALRHAPLRLLDLESICSGRSDQSDWLYQVRPNFPKPPNTLIKSFQGYRCAGSREITPLRLHSVYERLTSLF